MDLVVCRGPRFYVGKVSLQTSIDQSQRRIIMLERVLPILPSAADQICLIRSRLNLTRACYQVRYIRGPPSEFYCLSTYIPYTIRGAQAQQRSLFYSAVGVVIRESSRTSRPSLG